MKLSFVVPVYNEEKRIEPAIQGVLAFKKDLPHESEWIFVDDGSTDRTEEIARKALGGAPYRWIKFVSNRGKGRAVREGMLAAGGDYIFFSDADLSTPLSEYEQLLEALKNGSDVAVGSRGPGARIVVHQGFLRETMGRTFNFIARLFTFKGIRDSQCGFKGFRRQAAQRLFQLQKISGFSFDAEIIYLAQKLNYQVAEVPVTWINSKDSKVRMIRDSTRMLMDLLRIPWLHRKFRP